MIIIMLGAQGTGKGTVAKILSEGMNIPQIATGDIFRKNITEKTELGKIADEYISKGMLVPDEVVVPMIEDRLNQEDSKNGAILDGFPRTIEQANALKTMLDKINKKVDLVINLTTPREEIIDRILTRRVCVNPDCKATYNIKMHPTKVEGICDICGSKVDLRKDDSDPEAIKKRLEIYEEKTSPLIDYYKEQGVLQTKEVSIAINHLGKDVAEEILEKYK